MYGKIPYIAVPNNKHMRTYRLWKDNKLDGEFTPDTEEMKTKLRTWIESREDGYTRHYTNSRIVRFFLTDKEGMSSVFEESDFDAFYEDLSPVINAFDREKHPE